MIGFVKRLSLSILKAANCVWGGETPRTFDAIRHRSWNQETPRPPLRKCQWELAGKLEI
jgi:hypothetical protein